MEDSFSSLHWSNDSSSSVDISQSSSFNDQLSLSQGLCGNRLVSHIHDRIETMRSRTQEINHRIEKRLELALARYEGGSPTTALVSMRNVQKLRDEAARIDFVESQLVGICQEIDSKLEHERLLDLDTMTAVDLEHLCQAAERVEANAKSFTPSQRHDEELLEELGEIMKRDPCSKERCTI